MDPNATLAEIRALTVALITADLSTSDLIAKATRLAELTFALDEWITKGGFLPEAWHLAQLPPNRTCRCEHPESIHTKTGARVCWHVNSDLSRCPCNAFVPKDP